MDQLRLGLRLLGSIVSVIFSRLTRGPARPSWSLIFEALVLSLQRTAIALGREAPLEQRRAWQAIAPPKPLGKSVTIHAVMAGSVPARWIIPASVGEDGPVLLYFHGGSYRYGSFESHAELAWRLGRAAGARVLFVEYRLAPPNRFPAAVDDAVEATRWLCRSVAPHRIVVGGDSAGGALTLAALLALRDWGEPMPAAGLLLCPWVDKSARGGSLETNARWDWGLPEHFVDWATGYADERDWKDPRVSPTFASLARLPKLLIQVGGAEMLIDQVRAFAQKAQAAGVDVQLTEEPDMIHDWQLFARFSPVGKRSIAEAGAFIRAACAAALPSTASNP